MCCSLCNVRAESGGGDAPRRVSALHRLFPHRSDHDRRWIRFHNRNFQADQLLEMAITGAHTRSHLNMSQTPVQFHPSGAFTGVYSLGTHIPTHFTCLFAHIYATLSVQLLLCWYIVCFVCFFLLFSCAAWCVCSWMPLLSVQFAFCWLCFFAFVCALGCVCSLMPTPKTSCTNGHWRWSSGGSRRPQNLNWPSSRHWKN